MLDTARTLPISGVVRNFVAVTAGNLVGGTLLVAGVYWIAYLRGDHRSGGAA
jgi:formate/nitrite transporter FocA (FNT family)